MDKRNIKIDNLQLSKQPLDEGPIEFDLSAEELVTIQGGGKVPYDSLDVGILRIKRNPPHFPILIHPAPIDYHKLFHIKISNGLQESLDILHS